VHIDISRDGASAPCPRPHDEHSDQDERTGQEQDRVIKRVCALHVPYRADIHGLSRRLTVSRNRGSTVLSWLCHAVPKLDAGSIPVTRSIGKPGSESFSSFLISGAEDLLATN